jgi:hypothetical protein
VTGLTSKETEKKKGRKRMSLFDKLKNSVHQTYVKGAEKIIPTLKETKFLEEGVLTPEEVSNEF